MLAVCKYRNLNENEIVHSYYSSQMLANTWAGQFHPYGNQNEWPTYNGPTIVPDEKLVNRGRHQHKRIPMYMDEMQGRRMGHQARRSTRDNNQIGTSSSQGQISSSSRGKRLSQGKSTSSIGKRSSQGKSIASKGRRSNKEKTDRKSVV